MAELLAQWAQSNTKSPALGRPFGHPTCAKSLAESLDLLHTVPLLCGLNDSDLRILIVESRHRIFEDGEPIFYQGDRGTTCHIILEGRVRVFVIDEDGREYSVNLIGAGEIIGEMALFENLPRSASIEAITKTYTLELDQVGLQRCLRRSPALALGLLRAMSARLRSTTEEAERLTSLPVPERLLWRLQRLAQRSGRRVADGVQVMTPLTQQDLAKLVWTSRESVNRALGRLRDEGKLRLDGGWIVILDKG
ncbi:MAG: Crp/Fnr family transcriptional regulator [Anaerolineae bacterium]|nr:Crp/Fnr family transcriptional regulator [Anaerolineae bacterium]